MPTKQIEYKQLLGWYQVFYLVSVCSNESLELAQLQCQKVSKLNKLALSTQ